jgi:hypothetical protein
MKYKVRITQHLVEESRILSTFTLHHVSASLCGHYRVDMQNAYKGCMRLFGPFTSLLIRAT